jgi:trehalose-6-phosphate synthase
MHYLMWSDNVDEASLWNDYIKVNEIFAQEVIKNYQEGDISKKFAFFYRIM